MTGAVVQGGAGARVAIHQIFYNDATRAQLDPAFIPLDNTANPRPDWFEFWPIRNYLHENELDPETLYGFLSPSFFTKTGMRGGALRQRVGALASQIDAFLVPTQWEHTAYHRSHFEHGELFHPGLPRESRKFLSGLGIDVDEIVSYHGNAVFSNYVIAKPAYWNAWLKIADAFYDYCEAPGSELGAMMTSYGEGRPKTAMKTFIQERFASVVLSREPLRIFAYDLSAVVKPAPFLFEPIEDLAVCLHGMDAAKGRYCRTRNPEALQQYEQFRRRVTLQSGAIR